jgi:hypothetical protein
VIECRWLTRAASPCRVLHIPRLGPHRARRSSLDGRLDEGSEVARSSGLLTDQMSAERRLRPIPQLSCHGREPARRGRGSARLVRARVSGAFAPSLQMRQALEHGLREIMAGLQEGHLLQFVERLPCPLVKLGSRRQSVSMSSECGVDPIGSPPRCAFGHAANYSQSLDHVDLHTPRPQKAPESGGTISTPCCEPIGPGYSFASLVCRRTPTAVVNRQRARSWACSKGLSTAGT